MPEPPDAEADTGVDSSSGTSVRVGVGVYSSSEFGAGSGFGISFRDDYRSIAGAGIGVGDIAVSVSRVGAELTLTRELMQELVLKFAIALVFTSALTKMVRLALAPEKVPELL